MGPWLTAWLTARAALAGELGSLPSTHIWWLEAISFNFSSRMSDALSWLSWALYAQGENTLSHTHIVIKKIKILRLHLRPKGV